MDHPTDRDPPLEPVTLTAPTAAPTRPPSSSQAPALRWFGVLIGG